MLMEIQEQKIVSGCKNSFRTFYIAVMHYRSRITTALALMIDR